MNATLQPMPDAPSTRSIAALWLVLILAAATIATAWFFQLVLGYIPCKLCLQQRIPYYTGIPLAMLTLGGAVLGGSARLVRVGLLLLAVVFLVGAGLGIFHAGVEWKLWLGPADCGGGGPALPAKVGDLLGAISASKVVSCTEAAWRLFGISMAGWNAIVSALMVLLLANGLRKT